MCAIIKGIYLMQLRQQDFYYNGKDVVIWTFVETATAIIAASIPVLRVFFKHAVTSHSNSHSKSHKQSTTGSVPLSRLSRSRRSARISTIPSMGNGREGGWTTLDPIEDGIEDGSSQKSMLKDEEYGTEKTGVQIAEAEHRGIMQTNTITITSDVDSRERKGRSWLGGPDQ
jgi:hypothetical protein